VDSATLLELVRREFVIAGAETPPWPDPHEDEPMPREEEYSRTLDPAKYRIIGARAEAWACALESSGLARREPAADLTAAWRHDGDDVFWPPSERGEWLRPEVPHALPLLFALRSVHVGDNHLDVGVGDPAVPLKSIPHCGCDACDTGSECLLEELDEAVMSVVSGAFVYSRMSDSEVRGWANGWSASGNMRCGPREIEAAIENARGGRGRRDTLRGPAWWF
jgi:hypothetical protein